MRGGKRPRSGRPRGSRDKGKAALEALQAVNGEMPMQLWARVLSDREASLEIRLQVARDMAPYVHAKKATTEIQVRKSLNDFLAELDEHDSGTSQAAPNGSALLRKALPPDKDEGGST